MKNLIGIIGMCVLAVALVLVARYNSGHVVIMFPLTRVELSLNLLLLLIAVAFIVTYLLIRLIVATLSIPDQAKRFRESRQGDVGRAAFMSALKHYFEGRYGKAEKEAREALSRGESPALSAVIAARSAHETRAFDARDRYLAEDVDANAEDDYLRHITRAELMLEEGRYHDALSALRKLPDPGHTAALRLELKAQQLAKNWDRVAELLPQLEKKRVFDPAVMNRLKRTSIAESIKRKAVDLPRLRDTWDKVPPDIKIDNGVTRAAAQAFMKFGAHAEAHRIIEGSLRNEWDSQLLALYGEGLGPDAREQIQSAEQWLTERPRDAALLLTLGRLCAHAGLWGKARSYFEASLAVEASHTGHVELARLAERSGDENAAARHYRDALSLSLDRLKVVTGGRRETAL